MTLSNTKVKNGQSASGEVSNKSESTSLLNKRRIQFSIPRSKEDWLGFFVQMLKKKTRIEYLTDEEVRKVIIRARPNVNKKKPPCGTDKEMPLCYFWNEQEVADWINEIGFPQFQETFIQNFINGRRLILVNAATLSKMGIRNFSDIQAITLKIREILGIRKPNIMRAILRMSPFELYLQHRVHGGKTYDCMTFKKFCRRMKFPIRIVKKNKNAAIPCSVSVLLVPPEAEGADISDQGSDTSEISILESRSVEFVVRHQLVRNRVVQQMINDIIECLYDSKCIRRIVGADTAEDIMARLLEDAFLELGFCDPELYTKERIEFASQVAGEMLKEMKKTATILTDIKNLKTYIKQDVSAIEISAMQEITTDFMEQVGPVSALLALGELNLEAIFKQEPEFQSFIDDLIHEAEKDVDEFLPIAEEEVQIAIEEAKTRVMVIKEFPHLAVETVRAGRSFARDVWDDMISDVVEGDFVIEDKKGKYENEEEEEEDTVGADGYEEVEVLY